MRYVYDDGGRADAGYKGHTDDCVTRSIAIATKLPYIDVYDDLYERALGNRAYMAKLELKYGARANNHVSPRHGVARKIYEPYLFELGWRWTPTMKIGSGCTVHLRDGELPMGRLIVSVSKHITAVIDGVIHDNHDPSRGSNRCVYGFYSKE